MDAEDFKTLGDCDFGTIWEVQSENKVVVNAYQAALYFSRDDFFQFAKMVESAVIAATGKGFQLPTTVEQPAPPKEPEPSEPPQITDIRAFRKSRHSDDDGDGDDLG
jgi:hypothetical protein